MRRSNARTRRPPEIMDSTSKLQFRTPNNSSRSTLFPRSPKHSKSNILIVVIAAVAMAACFYLFVVFSGSRNNSMKKKFGIVIDGGSTGTRVHVFEYGIEGGVPKFDFANSGLASMRVNPGLSAYADKPEAAGGSLVELIEFAKGRVPKKYWGVTDVRLMATAGMRLLDSSVQEEILVSCRRVLRLSGFKFRDDWASVITGIDEGIYAWVVANYALGTLGGDPQETTGIIELGGASAQVTFVSSEVMPPEFSHKLKFGNSTYNLYSHSFLNFGQNVAFDSLRESLVSKNQKLITESLQKGISYDPCTPRGYLHKTEPSSLSPSLAEKKKYLSTLHARGNFSECRSSALTLLQKGREECSYPHCYLGPTFIPKLSGKFLATENFFYTSKFFELAPRAFLSGLMMAGQQFCQEDWSKLKKKYHLFHEEDLARYCFSSAYIVALLHDSLEVPLDDARIGYANQVGEIPLNWALGAFILRSTADVDVQHPSWISTIITDDSPAFVTLFIIAIILILTGWCVSKCRKPQFKTIYDLEKGRYIVTRVGR